MPDRSQQTEKPTERRVEKARKEGRFAVSREFIGAAQFAVFVFLIASRGEEWIGRLARVMRALLVEAFRARTDTPSLLAAGAAAVTREFAPLAAAGGAIVFAGLAAQLATTRMGFASQRLAPDLGRLNPLSRLRELPRQNLSAAVKSLLLLPIFAAAVWAVVSGSLDALMRLPLQPVERGAREVASALQDLLWRAAYVLIALGCFDLWRQKRRYDAELRMSKQELREEMKENEGNPQVKMRIRRIQRDLLRRRMMQEVPKATAVVVNPTHFAVAIRYSVESMAAPVVVAKGKNYLALRIRQKAMEHQVPIIENPPLAQALYKSSEVGQEIPAHLYRAVAEILAYIYKLMGGRLP